MKELLLFTLFYSGMLLSNEFDDFTKSDDKSLQEINVVDSSTEPSSEENLENIVVVRESILKMSPSKKVILISNENNAFEKGDFITVLVNKEKVIRAIVAKTEGVKAGIKWVKTYNPAYWVNLREGLGVEILRGDDSRYQKEKPKPVVAETANQKSEIKSEEDLYKEEKKIDESLEDNSKRNITTDNLLSLSYGTFQGVDKGGNPVSNYIISGEWAFQVEDNIFIEAYLGQSLIRDFPATDKDTKITMVGGRLKYTLKLPLYAYLQPYVGFQSINTYSPDLGTDKDPEVNTKEQVLIEKTKKKGVVFGATFLKRIVPGWFIRGNVGFDLMSIGATLEF